jgi:hypothetical protein
MLIDLIKKNGTTLETGGKLLKEDITVFPKLQNKTITTNGKHTADPGYAGLGEVDIKVEGGGTIPDGYVKPSGTKLITANGSHDVKLFEKVDVQVEDSGSSGGSGECSGKHVIEVAELPTDSNDVNNVYWCDGKYYVVGGAFTDLIVSYGAGMTFSYRELITEQGGVMECFTIPTKTTEGVLTSSETEYYVYYIMDENDVGIYEGTAWYMLSSDGLSFGGFISDVSEAVESEVYYGLGGGWVDYRNVKGKLTISMNGDHDVADAKTVSVAVPTMSKVSSLGEVSNVNTYGSTALVYGNPASTDPDTPKLNLRASLHPSKWEFPAETYPNTGECMPYFNEDFNGDEVWTDGTNFYLAHYNDHYKINIETRSLEPITWNISDGFYGYHVWSNGDNVYLSWDSIQYKLDKDAMTWEPMAWTGLTSFKGNAVWTYKGDTYYSYSNAQYKLLKGTNTWEAVTWNGMNSFFGHYIWTYGGEIYSSNAGSHHRLDQNTDTWENIKWNVSSSLYGEYMWTDGIDLYHSNGSVHRKYNKISDTWEDCSWTSCVFYGDEVWTDGSYVYVDSKILIPSRTELYWCTSGGTWYSIGTPVNLNHYVPVGTVPEGYVPEGTIPDGYLKPEGNVVITENVENMDISSKATATVVIDTETPIPSEIATEDEMNKLLETAEVGSVYKYVGLNGAYTNGSLYIVEAV